MSKRLHPLAGAGTMLILIGGIVWLFVSMLIGIVIGVVGLILLVVGLAMSIGDQQQQPVPQQPYPQQPMPYQQVPTSQQQPPVQANTKKCPYCAELIQAEAIKCRYCGTDLSE